MRFLRPAFVVAAAFGLAAPATAQSAQDVADARCVLAFNMFVTRVGDKMSESDKAILDSFGMYFIGKIRARSATVDLSTIMTPAIVHAVQDGLKDEVTRCNNEAGSITTDLQQTSKALGAAIAAGPGK